MFLALGISTKLPSWIVVAVVSRDILIVIGVVLIWLLGHPAKIRPVAVSKANTFAQLLLVATVLADEGFQLGLGTVRHILVWVVAVLTLASLGIYIRAWLRHVSEYESGDGLHDGG
jgi:cardiolipin synthase